MSTIIAKMLESIATEKEGQFMHWSRTKQAWLAVDEMHPAHILNCLRGYFAQLSNEEILVDSEIRAMFSALADKMGDLTGEDEEL